MDNKKKNKISKSKQKPEVITINYLISNLKSLFTKPNVSENKSKENEKKRQKGMFKSYLKQKGTVSKKAIPTTFTPSTLGTYYNMPKNGSLNISGKSFTINDTGVKIGIISFGGSYVLADLKKYWTTSTYYYNGGRGFNSNGTPIGVNFISVDGANNKPSSRVSDGASIENMLDLEIIGAMCPNATINMYFAPNTNQSFINVIRQACSNNNIVSISWGASELLLDSQTLDAIHNIFTSYPKTIVCVASGDNGSNDGIGNFFPCADFPSSSPNVISCGGTSLSNNSVEKAWAWNPSNSGGGGGAPSLYFLKNSPQNLPNFTYANTAFDKEIGYLITNNRTTPDIAFNADPRSGWIILVNGSQNQVGGTSAVAPFIAGYFGLIYNSIPNVINNLTPINPISNYIYNVYNNKSGVAGFVKPFNDITIGSTNNTWAPTTNYFNSIVGYDLCTGLGSFDGKNLLYYLSLQ